VTTAANIGISSGTTITWTTGSNITLTGTLTVGAGATLTNDSTPRTLIAPTVVVTGALVNNGVLTIATALSGAGALTSNSATSVLNIGFAGIPTVATLTAGTAGTVAYTHATPTGAVTCAITASQPVTTSITLSNTATWTTTTNVTLGTGGTLTVGAGTSMINAVNKTLTAPNLVVTTTLLNNGTIVSSTAISGAGTLTQGTTGTLSVGGTFTVAHFGAAAAGNTVNYTGAGQTVLDPDTGTAHTYSNLAFSGSGVKNATGANLIVVQNLTITAGTLSLLSTSNTAHAL
jgi:hypothetical protein